MKVTPSAILVRKLIPTDLFHHFPLLGRWGRDLEIPGNPDIEFFLEHQSLGFLNDGTLLKVVFLDL